MSFRTWDVSGSVPIMGLVRALFEGGCASGDNNRSVGCGRTASSYSQACPENQDPTTLSRKTFDMTTITSTIVGAAGEYHVLSQLLRRGWIAALAPDGAPNMDILVTDENSHKLCAIQVKTRRDIGKDRGWHMKPKHETMFGDDLFYVFVDVGKQPSDLTTLHVLPSKVVADCIRDCHQVWLETPGQGGRPHKDSSVRRLLPDYSNVRPVTNEGKAIIEQYQAGWMDPYRENWSILGLPEAESF